MEEVGDTSANSGDQRNLKEPAKELVADQEMSGPVTLEAIGQLLD